MAYQLDSDGNLDVDELTFAEKKEVFAKFEDILNSVKAKFFAEVGDTVSSDELSENEVQERLDSTPAELVWTDYYISNSDESERIEIVPGLSVYVSGPSICQGFKEQENVTGYIFSSKAPTTVSSVFYSSECECPLCWNGSTDDGECEICEGSGLWEWIN